MVGDSSVVITTGYGPGFVPGGGEIFCICPHRPCGLPGLLYDRYWVSLPGVERPGRGLETPPPSSTEITERAVPVLLG